MKPTFRLCDVPSESNTVIGRLNCGVMLPDAMLVGAGGRIVGRAERAGGFRDKV